MRDYKSFKKLERMRARRQNRFFSALNEYRVKIVGAIFGVLFIIFLAFGVFCLLQLAGVLK